MARIRPSGDVLRVVGWVLMVLLGGPTVAHAYDAAPDAHLHAVDFVAALDRAALSAEDRAYFEALHAAYEQQLADGRRIADSVEMWAMQRWNLLSDAPTDREETRHSIEADVHRALAWDAYTEASRDWLLEASADLGPGTVATLRASSERRRWLTPTTLRGVHFVEMPVGFAMDLGPVLDRAAAVRPRDWSGLAILYRDEMAQAIESLAAARARFDVRNRVDRDRLSLAAHDGAPAAEVDRLAASMLTVWMDVCTAVHTCAAVNDRFVGRLLEAELDPETAAAVRSLGRTAWSEAADVPEAEVAAITGRTWGRLRSMHDAVAGMPVTRERIDAWVSAMRGAGSTVFLEVEAKQEDARERLRIWTAGERSRAGRGSPASALESGDAAEVSASPDAPVTEDEPHEARIPHGFSGVETGRFLESLQVDAAIERWRSFAAAERTARIDTQRAMNAAGLGREFHVIYHRSVLASWERGEAFARAIDGELEPALRAAWEGHRRDVRRARCLERLRLWSDSGLVDIAAIEREVLGRADAASLLAMDDRFRRWEASSMQTAIEMMTLLRDGRTDVFSEMDARARVERAELQKVAEAWALASLARMGDAEDRADWLRLAAAQLFGDRTDPIDLGLALAAEAVEADPGAASIVADEIASYRAGRRALDERCVLEQMRWHRVAREDRARVARGLRADEAALMQATIASLRARLDAAGQDPWPWLDVLRDLVDATGWTRP